MKGWRGFAAGALMLIALEVLGSGKGPEQGGKLLGWVNSGLRRVMAADVPAIPTVGGAKQSKSKPDDKPDTGGIAGELPRNPPVSA